MLVFIVNVPFNFYLFLIRISLFLRLGLRVGLPLVGQALNVTDGRPPEVLPCPPPCG